MAQSTPQCWRWAAWPSRVGGLVWEEREGTRIRTECSERCGGASHPLIEPVRLSFSEIFDKSDSQ